MNEMELKKYFEMARGHGVIATADGSGKTSAAVYARPHVIDADTIAFIVAEGQTGKNLTTNPYATYLFIEEGESYEGKRLYLTKVGENHDKNLIGRLRMRHGQHIFKRYKHLESRLVFFHVDRVRPLIGDA